MLKALELAGFKSFADRTRFDFPDGITVVVGPNGSGKSNIVDAMKWVLGSQSAKSLRGKEMSDVIFKGSQTRAAAGAAEATIVFDNSAGNLPVDAPEVHVTRRVYRSGESEYLINKQSVRLKDVRDLIRGTGIGIDAYSLIEQGKVDRMLQANAKDRRAIFEEAAGISRFKAKKQEAQRRLTRVQSNLTRLRDIVDEVESRLKSVRSQAAKAERYRQSSERLKELRTVAAWTDWAKLSDELEQYEAELAKTQIGVDALQERREQINAERQATELELQAIAEQAKEVESQRQSCADRAATLTGRNDADQAGQADLRLSIANSLRRLRTLKREAAQREQEIAELEQSLQESTQSLDTITAKRDEVQVRQDRIQGEANEIVKLRELNQQHQVDAVRKAAEMESQRQSLESEIEQGNRTLQSLQDRIAEAEQALTTAKDQDHETAERVGVLQADVASAREKVDVAEQITNRQRKVLDRRSGETAELRTKLEGARQRYLVLEDLQQRQEGVASGVLGVLDQLRGNSRQADIAALESDVDGMVADLINADVDVAPMIDAALGDRAQFLVAHSADLADAICSGRLPAEGRVGIIRCDLLPEPPIENPIQLEGLQGVIGRADRVIGFDPDQRRLFSHLLASTWLVEDIATALQVQQIAGPGQRVVTRLGEVLESDGTMIVGPATASTGLISRRSELNAAAEEIERFTLQISDNDQAIAGLAQLVDEHASELGRLQIAHRNFVAELAAAEAERRHAGQRLAAAGGTHSQLLQEQGQSQQLVDTATQRVTQLNEQIGEAKQHAEALSAEAAEIEETLSETQQALQDAIGELTAVSVEIARVEQRDESLQSNLRQLRHVQDQHESSVQRSVIQAETGYQRLAELNERLDASAEELEKLVVQRDEFDTQLHQLAQQAETVRKSTRQINRESEQVINDTAKASESLHALTSQRDNATMRQTTLADRIKEDYQIDLHHDDPPEELFEIENRNAMNEEITKLRDQLQRTSNVNMEALAELEGLQSRYDHLSGQYEDLSAAKDSLLRIIGRINADSRRLFLDTLEAIRQNFQTLYRKSFGGGHADLVLEESEDPLEAGVEIIATPPGKPSFSNSLLSGGEKALTAVALLMAIFQYRPSPFCVLDEVDAPFDEANIGRFVTVLNEFLDHSKFVVVTHSKKTMTAATTLYGVTMQESGVSKRVSIRFEDVSEDGQISEDAA